MPTTLPYIPIADCISYAKISQFLIAEDRAKQQAFKGGFLSKNSPQLTYTVRKSLEWAYNRRIGAKGYISITGTFQTGGVIVFSVQDPIDGLIVIGSYTILSTDTTLAILAVSSAAAINLFGYSATASGNQITVVAPLYLGDTINGIEVSVIYTEPLSCLLINGTDNLLINSTDKFIL